MVTEKIMDRDRCHNFPQIVQTFRPRHQVSAQGVNYTQNKRTAKL